MCSHAERGNKRGDAFYCVSTQSVEQVKNEEASSADRSTACVGRETRAQRTCRSQTARIGCGGAAIESVDPGFSRRLAAARPVGQPGPTVGQRRPGRGPETRAQNGANSHSAVNLA